MSRETHNWLVIRNMANPKRGLTTQKIADWVGCSRRLVQVVLKAYKDLGRTGFLRKLNGTTSVKEQVTQWDSCGGALVTKYTAEGKQ